MKRRLDQLLVDRGLAPSRTRARDLVESRQVTIDGVVVDKPAHETAEGSVIAVAEGAAGKFVSRAGLKLEPALREAAIDPKGLRVLDVGQSTGGFTDCLLKAGAALVVGIDVGRDQLHASLRADPRVRFYEGVNARAAAPGADFLEAFGDDGPDLAVADLSFISLSLVLPPLARLVAPGRALLALVKPQFEVGPSGLGKGGVVRDPLLYPEVERKIRRSAQDAGWKPLAYFASALEGKDGNKEFFLHAVKV